MIENLKKCLKLKILKKNWKNVEKIEKNVEKSEKKLKKFKKIEKMLKKCWKNWKNVKKLKKNLKKLKKCWKNWKKNKINKKNIEKINNNNKFKFRPHVGLSPQVSSNYHSLFTFNSGKAQMSSCFLLTMREDSIEGIYDTLK